MVTGRVHRSASLAVIFFSVVTSGSSPALGSKITQEANLWSHTSNAFGRPSERPTVETSPHVRAGRSRLRPHRERRAGEADPSIILTGFDVLRGSALRRVHGGEFTAQPWGSAVGEAITLVTSLLDAGRHLVVDFPDL